MFVVELGAMFNQDVDLACTLIERVAEARDKGSNQPVMLKSEILFYPDCCLDDDKKKFISQPLDSGKLSVNVI